MTTMRMRRPLLDDLGKLALARGLHRSELIEQVLSEYVATQKQGQEKDIFA